MLLFYLILILVQLCRLVNAITSSTTHNPPATFNQAIPHSSNHFSVCPVSSNHIDFSARCPSSTNLNGLYMLLSAHPTTLPHFLHTTHQRTIHAVLSKCLVNSDPLIKFLAIACIALIAQHEPPDDSQDHPGSLFDGAKGMKVLKLGISTVLAELATPKEESVKIIRLCGISVNVLDQRLICEWLEMKGSGQQIKKLKDKVKGIKDGELLAAVMNVVATAKNSILSSFMACKRKHSWRSLDFLNSWKGWWNRCSVGHFTQRAASKL